MPKIVQLNLTRAAKLLIPKFSTLDRFLQQQLQEVNSRIWMFQIGTCPLKTHIRRFLCPLNIQFSLFSEEMFSGARYFVSCVLSWNRSRVVTLRGPGRTMVLGSCCYCTWITLTAFSCSAFQNKHIVGLDCGEESKRMQNLNSPDFLIYFHYNISSHHQKEH